MKFFEIDRLALILVALATFFVSANATATTVLKMDVPDLVEASDAIVVGDVAKVETKVVKGRVLSFIEIEVVETWKGKTPKTVSIVQVGGRTKELVTRVHGMPAFTESERVLVFLEKPTSKRKKYDHYVVTGMSQGKFTVTKSDDEEWHLKPKTEAMGTVAPTKMPGGDVKLRRVKPGEVQTAGQTLAQMKKRVDDLLAGIEDGETDAEEKPESSTE